MWARFKRGDGPSWLVPLYQSAAVGASQHHLVSFLGLNHVESGIFWSHSVNFLRNPLHPNSGIGSVSSSRFD